MKQKAEEYLQSKGYTFDYDIAKIMVAFVKEMVEGFADYLDGHYGLDGTYSDGIEDWWKEIEKE